MVLILAVALAVPVVISGIISNKRETVIVTAIVMAGIGIFTGNPLFVMADLFGVGIGFLIALAFCSEPDPPKTIKQAESIHVVHPDHTLKSENSFEARSQKKALITSKTKTQSKTSDPDHKEHTKKRWNLELNQSEFSNEELAFLNRWGPWLEAIEDGRIFPNTDDQRKFYAYCEGRHRASSNVERLWEKFKLLGRCERCNRPFPSLEYPISICEDCIEKKVAEMKQRGF